MGKNTLLMLSKWLVLNVLFLSLNACNFAQSINKDLNTGMVTRGNGLACEEVYLASNDEVLKRNTFMYGEVFHVNFDRIDGFNRQDGYAFPGMELLITGQQGDTVMYHEDLYAEDMEGFTFSPLDLYTKVTVADPMHSNSEYSLQVNIWDKKGKGTFKASMDFTVHPNEKIGITSHQISYKEIYLFSPQKGLTITDNRAGFGETIYMLFEGLDGFRVESGNVQLGLNILLKDAEGTLILNEEDLLGDEDMNYQDIHAQVAPNFVLTGSEIRNPVTCEITIWDKQSAAKITATSQLTVE